MKKNIKQLVNNFEFDNKQYMHNYKTVAEYIIEDAEASDQGWLWFLSDEEIEEFERSEEARERHVAEIIEFINSNYNYKPEIK